MTCMLADPALHRLIQLTDVVLGLALRSFSFPCSRQADNAQIKPCLFSHACLDIQGREDQGGALYSLISPVPIFQKK